MTLDELEYYATPETITDAGMYAALLDDLPTDLRALCDSLQGLMLHVHWVKRYGVCLPEDRKTNEPNLRTVHAQLERLLQLNGSRLSVRRPPEQRVLGTCRDYTTLLCAVFRHRGIPARARCGFATYFSPGHYEDHWICEYWNAALRRWVQVDAQLDALQRQVLEIEWDPLDLPAGQFVVAGEAWRLCRQDQADPEQFGIFDMHGLWFIRGNVMRDLAALNKVETLPWDTWGLMETASDGDQADMTAAMALMDRVAATTAAAPPNLDDILALYASDERLRWPGLPGKDNRS